MQDDILDLTGLGRTEIVGETVDADGDSTSGTINFLDSDGTVTGSMAFVEIEEIIRDPYLAGPVEGLNSGEDTRTGTNGRHRLAGFLRQSVFSRLAGYEDVNDADRLCRDPVMRQIVGGRAVNTGAASASAMGRFETEMLTQPENLAALTGL